MIEPIVRIVGRQTDGNDEPRYEFRVGFNGVTRIERSWPWFEVYCGVNLMYRLAEADTVLIEHGDALL